MATCPFCMSEVHDEALVCPQCNARKGYGFSKRGFNRDASGHKAGVVIFTAGAVAALILPMFIPMGFLSGSIFAGILGLIAFLNWRIIRRGPRWYR